MKVYLLAFCFMFYAGITEAQTVSILNAGDSPTALKVEAAIKRYLRAEGYTVKGGTPDGFLIVLQTMNVPNAAGQPIGVVASIIIGNVTWQLAADQLVPERCQQEHQAAQMVKDMLGTRIILIDSNFATGANEETVAELLSTYSNTVIRKTSQKMRNFLEEMADRNASWQGSQLEYR
jgi:hypothetical protein